MFEIINEQKSIIALENNNILKCLHNKFGTYFKMQFKNLVKTIKIRFKKF